MSKLKKLAPTLLVCILAVCLLCGTALAASNTYSYSGVYSITYTGTDPNNHNHNALTGALSCSGIESISAITITSGDQVIPASTTKVSGATVTLNGGSLTSSSTTGTVTVNTGATFTIAPQTTGTFTVVGNGGNLVVNGGTTVNVSGSFASITTAAGLQVTLNGDTTINGGTAKVTTSGTGFDYALTVNGGNVTMNGAAHLEWAKVTNGTLDLNGAQIKNESEDNSGYGLYVTGGTVKSTIETAENYPGNGNAANHIFGVKGGVCITAGTIEDFHAQLIKCTDKTADSQTPNGSALVSAGGTSTFTDCWFEVNEEGQTDPVVNVTGGTVTIEKDANSSKITGSQTGRNIALQVKNNATVTLKGANVISYNDNYAAYIQGTATFTDGTTVESNGETGVYVNEYGTVTANSTAGSPTTTITAQVYGIYLNGNGYGAPAIANLGENAEINIDTSATGECYGVCVSKGDSAFYQTGGVINATAMKNSHTANGVYVLSSGVAGSPTTTVTSARAEITGGEINVVADARTSNVNSATLNGIYNNNNGGYVKLDGGVVTVNAAGNGNSVFGIYNKLGEANFASGTINILGGGAAVSRGIQNEATAKFTGGKIELTGDRSCGVYNTAGNAKFEMGEHDQSEVAINPGAATHPYIYATNGNDIYGLNNENGTAKIFAGTIDITTVDSIGIYTNKGNTQVLANGHDQAIDTVVNQTVNVTVSGNGGKAFAVAGGDWAIRGRGSVFAADTALDVTSVEYNDGGYWHDKGCADTAQEGTAYKPLSGGTFKGVIKVYDGAVSDLLLENHYMRNDIAFPNGYFESSDGTRLYDIADKDAVGSKLNALTVTDAEWELRYALEEDNDINDYYMPINIELDYADEVHGTGGTDGDVDVDTGNSIEGSNGYHTLDLMDKTLFYDGSDSEVTTEPQTAIPSVIEVSQDGKLITVASGRVALENTPFTTTGVIKYGDAYAGVAVEVRDGEYHNGTPENDGVFKGDGAILKGTANGNTGSYNLWVSGGKAYLNSGMVGWESSSHTSVYVNGGELYVLGGGVYGNMDTETSIGIYAAGGKTTILGGTVKGDLQDYRAKDVYVNGENAQVRAETLFANDIGNVVVEAGRFDIYDGGYYIGEGDDAKLLPTEIQSLSVTGGSAYVDGGVIKDNSAVTGGELLVDDGVFRKDLTITGGNTTFVPWYVWDEEEQEYTDEIGGYGKVEGTVSVINAADNTTGSLLVDYADIQEVTTTTDGSSVALHGGLYGTITTSYSDGNNDKVSNGEYIGGFVAGADAPGMIPVNHVLEAVGTSNYLRIDVDTMSANATDPAKRMEIVPFDVATLLNADYVKLPCNIDLNYTDGGKVEWVFRDKVERISNDITEPEINGELCGDFKFTGPWTIEESQTKTLNLNGYYLTDSVNGITTILVDGGSLTVRDGYTENPDGAVIEFADLSDDSQNYYDYAISMNSGSLTVNSGAVISHTYNAISAGGGNITVSGTAKITGINGNGLYYDGSGNITVTGGIITSESDNDEYAGIYYDGSGILTISGGSFDNTVADDGFGVIITDSGATVNISGGTFGKDSFGGLLVDDAKKVSLTGGSYKSIVNAMSSGKLSDFISGNTTVTADSMDKVSTATSPTPTETPNVTEGFQPTKPSATVPVKPANVGDASLEDSALEQIDGHKSQITVTETKTFTTGEDPDTTTTDYTFTTVWNYMPMYTLTTGGGYVPSIPVTPVTPDKPALETEDHFTYLYGYTDGTVRPAGNLTRAEAASIFYRLLVDKSYTGVTNFTDVSAGYWAYTPIQALASRGIIAGYTDGSFRPAGIITRAELCAMASRFFEMTSGSISFTDVSQTYWAYKAIASAAGYGWIEDGATAFRPNDAITRTEAVTIINNMLGREADRTYVDEHLSAKYSDLPKTHADFYEIMEASVGHNYTKTAGKETWTGLQ